MQDVVNGRLTVLQIDAIDHVRPLHPSQEIRSICFFRSVSAGQVKLVLTLYKNLGSFLTTQNSTLRLSLGLGQGSDSRRKSLVVNSHVISASVHRGSSRVYLSEPVIFTLRHLQVGFGPGYRRMIVWSEQILGLP